MLSGVCSVVRDRADAVEASLLRFRINDSYQLRLKSSQWGFTDAISLIFFSRRQPFNCFSRPIAFRTSSKDS